MARLRAGARGMARPPRRPRGSGLGGARRYRERGPASASGYQGPGNQAAGGAARTPAAERCANAAGHTVSRAPNPGDPKGKSDDHHVSRPGGSAVPGAGRRPPR